MPRFPSHISEKHLKPGSFFSPSAEGHECSQCKPTSEYRSVSVVMTDCPKKINNNLIGSIADIWSHIYGTSVPVTVKRGNESCRAGNVPPFLLAKKMKLSQIRWRKSVGSVFQIEKLD